MPKFAVGEIVEKTTGDHSHGVVVAVFSTVDGSYQYFIDTEGYGTLQSVVEDKLATHTAH
jgi:hypothetical protein